jgi:hypothetical protein
MARLNPRRCASGLEASPSSRSKVCAGTKELGRWVNLLHLLAQCHHRDTDRTGDEALPGAGQHSSIAWHHRSNPRESPIPGLAQVTTQTPINGVVLEGQAIATRLPRTSPTRRRNDLRSTIPDAACEPAVLARARGPPWAVQRCTDPAMQAGISCSWLKDIRDMLRRMSGAATRSGALQAGVFMRNRRNRLPRRRPLDRGFLTAGNRLVAADGARDAGVHAAAPGKTLAQHVAPMTLCRRRPSATRRSFHSAARQIL